MSKIKNDKYYTPKWLVKYVIDKANEIIGKENITQFLEPSAGDGRFLNSLPPNTLAYDLYPDREDIIKQDYLKLDLEYKNGRCIIGNPPYGNRNNLALKFCNKSFELGEYVVFILPISQLNNTYSIYKYNLIYSENLGMVEFSDRKVHTCLNIYKRPKNGFNTRKKVNSCKLIEMKEVRYSRNQFLPSDFKYDIGICTFGSVGTEVFNNKKYVQELYIKILREDLKEEIIEIIRNANWKKIFPMTKSPRLKQWQVNKYIKDKFKKRSILN